MEKLKGAQQKLRRKEDGHSPSHIASPSHQMAWKERIWTFTLPPRSTGICQMYIPRNPINTHLQYHHPEMPLWSPTAPILPPTQTGRARRVPQLLPHQAPMQKTLKQAYKQFPVLPGRSSTKTWPCCPLATLDHPSQLHQPPLDRIQPPEHATPVIHLMDQRDGSLLTTHHEPTIL